jgi:diguanylate cyclase (GGDEF)-like protein
MNRRSFVRQLEAEVARSLRYKRPLALLVFDLDELKTINDTYGHPTGDEALQHVASMLTSGLRAGDQAFRIGGDEFAVLLTEAGAADARAAADRIAALLEDSPVHSEWKLSTSYGIAVCDEGCESGTLMRTADDDMYAMKRSRRVPSDGLDAVA